MEEMKRDRQLRIFSTNINGLNSPQKRTFLQIKELKAEIICLQDTCIRAKESKYLECKTLGERFIALDKDKKRDLVMYVKLILADEEGRTLMIEIQREIKKLLIMTIYAPKENQQKFYDSLHQK